MYCSYRRAAFSPARTLSTLVMAWCSLHLSLTWAEPQPPVPQAVAPAASTAAAAQHVSPLTLDDALLSAESRSGEVAAKASAAAAARAMSEVASRLPDPSVRLDLDNLPVNGADAWSATADFMTMRRIGLAQEFTGAAKRRAAAGRYEREGEQRLAERDAMVAVVRRETALAWLERHFAEQILLALDEQLGSARAGITAVEGSYRAGRSSQSDVIAAHAALVELEDRRDAQIQRVGRARIALMRWIGDAGAGPLAAPPTMATVPVTEDTLTHDLAVHPEVVALQRQHEAALADAELARANRRADWTVELSYTQRGPAYSNMISLGVEIPLQWDRRRRQDQELAARLALANEVQAQRDVATRDHEAQARTLLSDWRALSARAERIRTVLLPLTRERLRASVAAFAGGKGSLPDLTAARQAELETRLRGLELEAEAAQLWARLRLLLPREARHRATPPNATGRALP